MMKKITFLFILLLTFSACVSKKDAVSLEVNDSLSYVVSIKNKAEFILIKEGISIDEATQIILDNLDIETNADNYQFDWYGEAYSDLTREDIEEYRSTYYDDDGSINIYKSEENPIVDAFIDDVTDTSVSKELTLNNDSFRPIELVVDFIKDGNTETFYKQILVCVAEEEQYNVLKNSDAKTIEEAYVVLWNHASKYTYNGLLEEAQSKGQFSNIKTANGSLVGNEYRYYLSDGGYVYYEH